MIEVLFQLPPPTRPYGHFLKSVKSLPKVGDHVTLEWLSSALPDIEPDGFPPMSVTGEAVVEKLVENPAAADLPDSFADFRGSLAVCRWA